MDVTFVLYIPKQAKMKTKPDQITIVQPGNEAQRIPPSFRGRPKIHFTIESPRHIEPNIFDDSDDKLHPPATDTSFLAPIKDLVKVYKNMTESMLFMASKTLGC
jgi:hypothetical protein